MDQHDTLTENETKTSTKHSDQASPGALNVSDTQNLIESSDEDDDERDDYAFPSRRRYGSRPHHRGTTWWFQEPAVRKNWWVVLVAWGLLIFGIFCFITGIVLEIVYHNGSDDIIRGLGFMIVAVLVFIPSVYVVLHVYLAAKRVGRIRFSSVWFFSKS